jgi:hypothetical protein
MWQENKLIEKTSIHQDRRFLLNEIMPFDISQVKNRIKKDNKQKIVKKCSF